MKLIAFVLFILGVAETAKTGKLWNGVPAQQIDFQYMASLKDRQGNLICGGAVLAVRWILSAAHCDNPNTAFTATYIGVGNVDLTRQTNYGVDFTVPYPGYFSNSRFGDILLVKTSTKIELSTGVVSTIPINSNTNADLISMSSMKIAGWGLSQAPNNYTLMSSTYSNQKQNYCWQQNNAGNMGMAYSPEIELCAIASTSTPISPNGICSGDTGSPLVYNGLVYGVAQRQMNCPCASNYPDVFTRVAYYSTWINDVINGNM